MGARAAPGSHVVADGKPVVYDPSGDCVAERIYIALNKPVGVISSARDQFGRKTVVDMLGGGVAGRVYPAGRLDYDSCGLMLLTDDGDYAYRATHPKFGVEKTYEVIVDKAPDQGAIERLRAGVVLADGYRTFPADIYPDGNHPEKLTFIIREGRNRQIRAMAESIGRSVVSLTRTAIGSLRLDGLTPGEWRSVGRDEANMIFTPSI
jgi:23S rRNA pseudouridine2605 synthase